ncbi:MAG: hypothetical protein PHP92_05655 [Candidatus Nanoarchaeia archaeon]|nr:hypothetical protein [Candidatus Nanoarchaeia archaeon]
MKLDVSKIKQEFVDKMDAQEKFFRTMKEMEDKHGFEFIAGFLATSKAIEKQYLDYKNKKKPDIIRDFYHIAFHHSMDRTITKHEHITLIINAYQDYKNKRSWRNQELVIKRLVEASRPEIGSKNRQRFNKRSFK